MAPIPADRFDRPCRLAVADDDAVFRFAISAYLESDPAFEVVGVATSGPEAIELAEQADPPLDVLVLDLNMPGADGCEVAERLRRTQPELKCLVLTGTDPEDVAPRLHRVGAAYMQKGREPLAITERLQALAAAR